jgi:hypothetical protein
MRPRFELTTFSQPVEGRTDVVDALTKTGVPKAATEPDTFWETFVQDVESGDYSTADVVKDHSR